MKRFSCLAFCMVFTFVTIFTTGCGNKDTAADATTTLSSTQTSTTQEEVKIDKMGKYSEPVVLTAVLGFRPSENPNTPKDATPETNSFVTVLKDKYNIELKFLWTVPTDQFDQKFGVSMAAGNLPDLLMMDSTKGRFENLYEQNQLVDLTDVYNDYATDNLKKFVEADGGTALNSIKKDGKIFGIPNYMDPKQTTQLLWVRDDWMKKLDLQAPKTIDELEAMADAFVNKDPDGNGKKDTFGLGFHKKPIFWGFDMRGFFNGYGAYPMNWIKDASGNLVAGEVQPQVKEALARLQSMYKKGLIDKEFAMKDDTKFVEDIVSGKVGLVYGEWWYPNWPLNMVKDNNPNAEWKCYPIPSADGKDAKTLNNRVWISNILAVNKTCKNPDAAIKMLNFYTEFCEENYPKDAAYADGKYIYTWVPFKIEYPMLIDYTHDYVNDAIAGNKDAATLKDTLNSGAITAYKKSKLWLETKKGNENWGAYYSRVAEEGGWGLTKKIVAAGNIAYNEFYGPVLPTQQEKGGSLEKMMEETYDKIIMGEDISKFDEYVEKWNKLGGSDLVSEANEWFKKNQN